MNCSSRKMPTQRRPKLLVLFLAFAALVSGCADMGGIAPRAHLADPHALGLGKEIDAIPTSPANWPTEKWWEIYQDKQLNALVEQAIKDNPSIKSAAARIDEALAVAGIVQSESTPQVGARASAGRIRYSEQDFIPPPYAGNYAWSNSAFLSASYELDLFGKQSNNDDAALDNVHASQAEAQQARLALQSLVVHAYIDLSLQYALRDAEQSALIQEQKLVEIAQRRRAIGLGTQLEVSQAQAPIPVTQGHLKQINERIESLQHQLAALASGDQRTADTITRPVLKPIAGIALPSNLPAELLGHRPDIVANRWRVEAHAHGIDVAKTEFYPNVNLSAMLGFQSLGFNGFLNNKSLMDGVTPAISLPIFTGGKLRSNLGVQTARYDQAVERYNQSVIDALHDVADQISALRSLTEQQHDTQNAIDLANRSYDLALRGYRSGLTDYTHVLSAQLNVLTQHQNDVRVQFGQLNAYAGLMRSLGGGAQIRAEQNEAHDDN